MVQRMQTSRRSLILSAGISKAVNIGSMPAGISIIDGETVTLQGTDGFDGKYVIDYKTHKFNTKTKKQKKLMKGRP